MNLETFLLENAVFTTRHCATVTGQRAGNTSRTLGTLADKNTLVRVTRGLWAQPRHPAFTPFAAISALLGNEHGYVSFLCAMHRHGLISQIPGSIQIGTTGHTRGLESPIARFEFIRMHPRMMMAGIELTDATPPYGIATAEKALLDTLYIRTRKRNRFSALPELNVDSVKVADLYEVLDAQLPAPAVRSAVESHLQRLSLYRR